MKKRDRIILTAIGCVILLGGFWMLVLSPKMKQSKELSSEITKASKEIDQGQEQAKEVKATTVDFSKTYATLAKLGKAVPEAGSVDDDVPSLLLQLNQGGKVTKTAFESFELGASVAGAEPAPAAAEPAPAAAEPAPAAAGADTPTEQGAPAGADAGASGAEGAPAAPPVTLNEVTYKYSYQGTLYELENLMNYLTNLVNVEGQRMKISGRLMEIKTIDFTVVAASSNPSLRTNVEVVTYTTPEGESIATGGGAAGQSAAAGASGSPDAVPGAQPQAQPATPPSASVKRP